MSAISTTAETSAVKPTVDFKRLLENIQYATPYELCMIFDEWPLDKVRTTVITRLQERPVAVDYEDIANWAEKRIIRLASSENYADQQYGKTLFNWYLFRARECPFAVRALEFATAILKTNPIYSDRIVAEICGKLRHQESLYWQFPSVDWFLGYLFSGWEVKPYQREGEYIKDHWLCVERAVRRIIDAQDVRYLAQIEAIHSELASGSRKPDRFLADEMFETGRHLRFLEDAVKILKAKRENQLPDLNATLGAHLRQAAKLQGSVTVKLLHQKALPADGTYACIELRVEATIASESGQLAKILDDSLLGLTVGWSVEGFDRVHYTKSQTSADVSKYITSHECERNDVGWHVYLRPTPGVNRFTLTAWTKFRQQEVVSVIGYITTA